MSCERLNLSLELSMWLGEQIRGRLQNSCHALKIGSGRLKALISVSTQTPGVGICMWIRLNFAKSLPSLELLVFRVTASGNGSGRAPRSTTPDSLTTTATGTG